MYYSVSHLQPVVESDELFHPILPSVRINMLVIMKKSNLTCACQATMSSHSMGSPSDSSPILLHFTFSRLGLRSLLRCRNPPLTPVPWSRSQLWWVRQCGGVRVRARVLCVGRRHARWPTEDQLATAFFCLLRNIRSACKVEKIYTTLPGVQCQTGTRYPTR